MRQASKVAIVAAFGLLTFAYGPCAHAQSLSYSRGHVDNALTLGNADQTFGETGTYTLRGVADDGGLTGYDDVVVTVTGASSTSHQN